MGWLDAHRGAGDCVDVAVPDSVAVPGRTAALAAMVAGGMAIIAGLAQMVCAALSDVDFSGNFPKLRDPVTVVAPLGTAYNLAQNLSLPVLLAGVVGLIARFRRSGQEQRLQLKWFMYASAISAVAILAGAVFANNVLIPFDITFPLIPAAVGIAILKYRLYDIDRVISRTLAYAIVTGLLVGVYAGLVLLATQVFRFHTPVAVAASTLVAAALFSPLRRRVQQVVDRRFNRVRYDADQMVAAFAARLRDAVDLGTVRADLLATVNSAVEPAHISVWIARQGPPALPRAPLAEAGSPHAASRAGMPRSK
jgi:hypothetical protein